MYKKEKTVCFTGHRTLFEPRQDVEKKLEDVVRRCIVNGARTFITGGAIGFDTIAAQLTLRLRSEFPNIYLALALPCPPEQQTLKWTNEQKAEYYEILNKANFMKIVSERYTSNCMYARKDHIHNHIIINSVNSVTGKSFSLEHDQFKNPAWKQIREISDKLCTEYGLSVIPEPEKGKGKDHFEWEQDKAGNSWKSKLRAAIDDCIKTADSFDDFLNKMQERGYEIKHGKHIAFRAEGQERFTRAKTLGFYYQEENIRFRIDRRLMYRERENTPKTAENVRFVQMDEKVQASEGLRRWALLQNMKNASQLLNQLSERGIESEDDLKQRILGLYDDRIDITDEIKSAEKEITELSQNIRTINDYISLKPVNEQYKNSKNKDKYFREHESELRIFDSAKRTVKPLAQDNKLPNPKTLEKRRADLSNKKAKLMKQYSKITSEISELENIQRNIEKMERSGQEKEKSQSRQDELS